MKNDIIKKTIKMIKKCANQPIVFQILYCHLGWICANEFKNVKLEGIDLISSLILHGCLRRKIADKNLEKQIFQFMNLIKSRKKYTQKESFIIKIILCYFINLESKFYNYSILADFMHNSIRKDTLIDYLVIKYFNRFHLSSIYNSNFKNKMNKSIIENFLKRSANIEMAESCKLALLPNYIFYDIVPMKFEKGISNKFFIINLIESFFIYAKYAKNPEHVKIIMPENEGFLKNLDNFIKMINLDEIDELEYDHTTVSLLIEDTHVFDSIKMFYLKSVCKNECKKRLIEFIGQLE